MSYWLSSSKIKPCVNVKNTKTYINNNIVVKAPVKKK